MVNGVLESIIVNKELNDFKARGELVYTKDNIYYYQVRKNYTFEDTSRHIISNQYDKKVGAKGDIFVTSRNPLKESPIMGLISKKTWIGHTGLVIDDRGKETIEVTGNLSREENVVTVWPNTWLIGDSPKDPTEQIAVLRIKNTTEEQRQQIVDFALSKVGSKYNYTFLLNRSTTFYCSDLVSRSVAKAGININYDYLATTGSDMIVSKNTYFIFYREVVYKDDAPQYHIYYLSD
jgi:hypothetical protein